MGETLLPFQNIYCVRTEYGEIVNASEIPNGKYEIDNVWNESDNEKVPDEKEANTTTFFLLMMI